MSDDRPAIRSTEVEGTMGDTTYVQEWEDAGGNRRRVVSKGEPVPVTGQVAYESEVIEPEALGLEPVADEESTDPVE